MQLGRVVGTVWATQKDPKIESMKLLVVETLDHRNRPTGAYAVAADAVGAGIEEVVLIATGSSARQTRATEGKPIDAVVMAIVDSWDVAGEVVFEKSAG